jgi:hypothetical protein
MKNSAFFRNSLFGSFLETTTLILFFLIFGLNSSFAQCTGQDTTLAQVGLAKIVPGAGNSLATFASTPSFFTGTSMVLPGRSDTVVQQKKIHKKWSTTSIEYKCCDP